MIPNALFETLHCPHCGVPLEREAVLSANGGTDDGIDNGIARCGCARYPIVAGILMLSHRRPTEGEPRSGVLACLERDDARGALCQALSLDDPIGAPRALWQRAVRFCERRSLPLVSRLGAMDRRWFERLVTDETLTLRRALGSLRAESYVDYLYHRFASPSFVAGIAVLLLLEELCPQSASGSEQPAGNERPYVLDVSCGIGHSTYLIRNLFPELGVVASDHDFINLYLAHRFLVPDVPLVCLDAEYPLPFADDWFAGVFCLDALHYLHAKAALLRELDRVVESSGLWLFPHLHNALVYNHTAGIPLRPEHWLQCFSFVPARLYPESEVLHGFLRQQTVDLETPPRDDAVQSANALSLVASRRESVWRRHHGLTDRLCSRGAGLQVNPIYRQSVAGTRIDLELNWPSDLFKDEFGAIKDYLPTTSTLDTSLLAGLRNGTIANADLEVVKDLVRSFVLVRLPESYVG